MTSCGDGLKVTWLHLQKRNSFSFLFLTYFFIESQLVIVSCNSTYSLWSFYKLDFHFLSNLYFYKKNKTKKIPQNSKHTIYHRCLIASYSHAWEAFTDRGPQMEMYPKNQIKTYVYLSLSNFTLPPHTMKQMWTILNSLSLTFITCFDFLFPFSPPKWYK